MPVFCFQSCLNLEVVWLLNKLALLLFTEVHTVNRGCFQHPKVFFLHRQPQLSGRLKCWAIVISLSCGNRWRLALCTGDLRTSSYMHWQWVQIICQTLEWTGKSAGRLWTRGNILCIQPERQPRCVHVESVLLWVTSLTSKKKWVCASSDSPHSL